MNFSSIAADVMRRVQTGVVPKKVRELNFGFFGSFQCRLATDNDDTNSSPSGPDPSLRIPFTNPGPRPGLGWTFDFGERRFDRILRLSQPVDLRKTGLIHPWNDCKVIGVKADRGAGLQDLASDPMVGQTVSLGGNAMLDADGFRNATREALVNFEFQVGSQLSAKPISTPRVLTNTSNPSMERYREYKILKRQRLPQIESENSNRAAVLKFFLDDNYAQKYSYMGTMDRCPLSPPQFRGAVGILAEIEAMAKASASQKVNRGRWEVHIDLYQFDADTLVGWINGWVKAFFT